jgi:hypothetical protein
LVQLLVSSTGISMFGLFKSNPYVDFKLGTFVRKGGKWWGHIQLADQGKMSVALSGDRNKPHESALRAAHQFPPLYSALSSAIQNALFEHYEPYLQAYEDGEYAPGVKFPRLKNDPTLWKHVRMAGLSIDSQSSGVLTEIAYETDWDMEHTLGARISDGRLVELNGSI